MEGLGGVHPVGQNSQIVILRLFFNILCRLLLRITNCHSEAFFNTLCRLLLRLTNRHSEALAEESLKLSNSYRDSSVVSLLQNDRCKCISPPDGWARGGTARRVHRLMHLKLSLKRCVKTTHPTSMFYLDSSAKLEKLVGVRIYI